MYGNTIPQSCEHIFARVVYLMFDKPKSLLCGLQICPLTLSVIPICEEGLTGTIIGQILLSVSYKILVKLPPLKAGLPHRRKNRLYNVKATAPDVFTYAYLNTPPCCQKHDLSCRASQ